MITDNRIEDAIIRVSAVCNILTFFFFMGLSYERTVIISNYGLVMWFVKKGVSVVFACC